MHVVRIVAVAALLSAACLSACHREGPAEEAGEKIDKAASKLGDKMEDAGDKLHDQVRGH